MISPRARAVCLAILAACLPKALCQQQGVVAAQGGETARRLGSEAQASCLAEPELTLLQKDLAVTVSRRLATPPLEPRGIQATAQHRATSSLPRKDVPQPRDDAQLPMLALGGEDAPSESKPVAVLGGMPVVLLSKFDPFGDYVSPEAAKFNVPVFFMVYVGYFAATVAYEVACFERPVAPGHKVCETGVAAKDSKAAKPREGRWDFARFVLHLFIVGGHLYIWWFEKDYGGDKDKRATTWMHTLAQSGDAFEMGGFAFLSGVFGSNMSGRALENMFCYTAVTTILFTVLVNAEAIGFLGARHVELAIVPGPLWYMPALFVWRLTISPLNQLARAYGVPFAVTYLTCTLFLLSCRHTLFHLADGLGNCAAAWQRMLTEVCTLGILFCTGLWMSPSEWLELFSKTWVVRLSMAITFAWLVVYQVLGQPTMTSITHLQDHWSSYDYAGRPFSVSVVVEEATIVILKSILTLSVVCSLAACVEPWRSLEGVLSTVIIDNGSRGIYGYLLHAFVLIYIGCFVGVPLYTRSLPFWVVCIVWPVLTLMTGFTFTSKLTGKCFEWMVLPYWAKRIWGSS